jgi:hypothetical protein
MTINSRATTSQAGLIGTLADEAMEPDEEEAGLVVTHMPKNPNPVTQSEMDAGSIELF